jgi:hypothetical protein
MPSTPSSQEATMTGAEAGRLVAAYLRDLERELADLPRARRTELLEEIGEHIDEAVAEELPSNEAEVRTLLDRIGEPADIAEEARERFGVRRRGNTLEVFAILMLTIGGLLLPILGWFIGVALLWSSPAWTQRDKLLGTLIVPGGLAPFFFAWLIPVETRSCSSIGYPDGTVREYGCTPGTGDLELWLIRIGVLILFLAPLAMAFYLARRMRRTA